MDIDFLSKLNRTNYWSIWNRKKQFMSTFQNNFRYYLSLSTGIILKNLYKIYQEKQKIIRLLNLINISLKKKPTNKLLYSKNTLYFIKIIRY